MLTPEEIEYLKENKHQITFELLEALRAQGSKGKHLALEILDLPKNEKQFYLDAFGEPVSFDGNKGLKKEGTTLSLFPIHTEEFERCKKDFHYFRENYITIKTPHGIDFPEMRDYQTRLIDELLDDENEEVVGLIGRQCVAEDTTVVVDGEELKIGELWDLVDLDCF